MLKDIDLSREYITTPEAAQRSGLTRILFRSIAEEGQTGRFPAWSRVVCLL